VWLVAGRAAGYNHHPEPSRKKLPQQGFSNINASTVFSLFHFSAGGSRMPVDRVVVSSEEIQQVAPLPQLDAPSSIVSKLPPPIPWWAKTTLSFLVLTLPLLCIVAIVFRIAFRRQSPRIKYAWVSFLSTLLVISGFLTTVGTVLFFSLVPVPSMVNTGLPELDERVAYPPLPSTTDLTGADISTDFKPLVVVISPAARFWNRQERPSAVFGAGVLLHADKDGYLFATAKHVVNYSGVGSSPRSGHVLVSTESGTWSKASIVATAPELDLALLWVGRNAGSAVFDQPIAAARDGENIFVIGHPEGLKFTLSTGIISGIRGESLQISAAVSPGNSGGPIYDDRGNLIGIVSSKFDNSQDPNAENLGFAAKANDILKESNWTFRGSGRKWLDQYVKAMQHQQPPAQDDRSQANSQE
jgi:S1-C subfamily serine protease